MDALTSWLEKSLVQHASDKDFVSRIKKGCQVFDKYYNKTDISPLYAAALVLHPMRRTAYIKANWKDKWAKVALRKVKELWEVYREQAPTSLSPLHSRLPQQLPKELDEFDRIAQNLGKYTRPASQDENQDYASGEPCDIGKVPALTWWCQDQQRKRWPRLSYMAMDILSIPAMSDEPERVFSGARRTITWEQCGASGTQIPGYTSDST